MRHWFIFTLAVLIAFFGMIYSRISLDRDAFVLDELEEKIQVEEARHWDLRLEVARLQAPTRITQMASEMGLVYPTERSDLVVPGVDVEGLDPEYRWAQLRSVLSAQP
jgi:cell division protein FtsL